MPAVFSSGMRQPGDYVSGAIAVPTDATGFRIDIDRSFFGGVTRNGTEPGAEATTIAWIYAEISVDGTNWVEIGGFSFPGGDLVETWRDGVPRPVDVSTLKLWFKPDVQGNPNLQVRARYSVWERARARIDAAWLYNAQPYVPPGTHASVAYEDSDYGEITSSNSISLGPGTTTGSDRLALALCCHGNSGGGPTVSSCIRGTGGGSETFTAQHNDTHATYFGHYAGYFIAPATSSKSTVITYSAAGSLAGACVLYLSGAHQTSPIEDTQHDWDGTSTYTSCSVTLASQSSGMCFDVIGVYSNPTCDASQTAVYEHSQTAGSDVWYESTSYEVGAASVSMDWTWSGSDPDWFLILGVAVAPSSAASDVLPQTLSKIERGEVGSPCQLHTIEEGYAS